MAVFVPNLTSRLIVDAVCSVAPEETWIWAELGCGDGWISSTLVDVTSLTVENLTLSDLSVEAISAAEARFGSRIAKNQLTVGPGGEHLGQGDNDLIICDIAAISDLFCTLYDWYDGVPADCGLDGLSNLRSSLPCIAKALKPGGIAVFPVISLSDTDALLRLLDEHFDKVVVSNRTTWPLPTKPEVPEWLEAELKEAGMQPPHIKYGRRLAWTSTAICTV